MPCDSSSSEPECRCGPGEKSGVCFESGEPEKCQHPDKYNYGFASGPPAIRYFYCPACKARWEAEDKHAYVSPGHCGACMRAWIGPDAVLEDAEDVPMTPEEEEEAPEDKPPRAAVWKHPEGRSHENCPTCWDGPQAECMCCNPELADGPWEPPPPQPERRPPNAVAYSVNGHLYEVAVSGDASVRAVDGALVIQHHLGPVAGIVQVLPIIDKESAHGAEADH
jgi:hypothetical protein